MSDAVTLSAESRTKPLGQVRAVGFVPGVLYGHGISNENVQIESKQFGKAFIKAGYTTLVKLEVGGRTHNVLVREVQFHPVRNEVTHVDFYQVRLDEKVRAQVPLEFVGEAAAVKDLSGVLVKSLAEIDLEAFPQDLPRDIEVDISVLKDFDAIIHVSDLKLPSGITLFNEPTEVVAVVQPPRSEQELESLKEEAKEDVSAVEVVKKEKAEEEPAEGEEAAAPAAKKEEKKG